MYIEKRKSAKEKHHGVAVGVAKLSINEMASAIEMARYQ
jgi:hypothetical protein